MTSFQFNAAPETPVCPALDSSRAGQVHAVISTVRDPEIDETVAALNFIVGTDIEGDMVTVSLRLPTFWCPANFVFLMADEMRSAVMSLDWVRSFRMQLVDHFAADEINRGVNEGLSFVEVFPGQARSGLEGLRRTFDEKAFYMRQGALIEFMRREGRADTFVVEATVGEIDSIATLDGGNLAELWAAYLEKLKALDLEGEPNARAVVNLAGQPVAVDKLPDHLREIRKVTTSARSNGEMCRILMASRREGVGCGVADIGSGQHNTGKETI